MGKHVGIVIIVGVFIYGGYMALPRGLRNNNPGNIRLGEQWKGMRIKQTDSDFVQFTSVEYGIRAMARVLRSYRNRGVISLKQIIHTWAPPVENNTSSYLEHVKDITGWDDYYFPAEQEGDYVTLIAAIIKHENGVNPYSGETIREGVARA